MNTDPNTENRRSSRQSGAPSCPVCDERALGPIESFSSCEAAAHFCPPTRDEDRYERLVDCIDALWPDGACEIYRCPACGFGFGRPFVGGDETFYGILHEQMDYPGWRWDYDVALDVLASHRPGPILDVGAGTGTFLAALDEGWTPYAVEASPATRSELEAKGIETYGAIADIDGEGAFRGVTMFQTLEHIAAFDEVIRSCRDLLCPGGVIVLTVPDADAMFEQEAVVGYPDMPPNHINKWTPESLRRALEDRGFDVVDVRNEPKSLGNVLSKVHMKIMSEADEPRSLAAQVYRIPDRRIRKLGLAALAPFALLRMIHAWTYLLEGGAFCMVGRRRDGIGE